MLDLRKLTPTVAASLTKTKRVLKNETLTVKRMREREGRGRRRVRGKGEAEEVEEEGDK